MVKPQKPLFYPFLVFWKKIQKSPKGVSSYELKRKGKAGAVTMRHPSGLRILKHSSTAFLSFGMCSSTSIWNYQREKSHPFLVGLFLPRELCRLGHIYFSPLRCV